MPTVEENRAAWDDDDLAAKAENWSRPWGGSAYQWWGTIYPRVMPYLPAQTILEIATGNGRWTEYLLPHCERFIGVDLIPSCIEKCRARFPHDHAAFYANDGRSLDMVDEADFVFSFDSLVHVELDEMRSYVSEIARVLTPEGAAFIHHSNLAGQDVKEQHGRGRSVNAALVAEACEAHGLYARQEIIHWGPALIDCFSLISRTGPSEVRTNPQFRAEIRRIREIAALYARPSG